MIPSMFWRLVTSRWVALLGLVLAFFGVPGTLQDAAVWFGWFGQLPRFVFIGAAVVGVLLILAYVLANRRAIHSLCSKLVRPTRDALAAFPAATRQPVDPPDPQEDPAPCETPETEQWQIIDHTVRKTAVISGEAYPALVGMAKAKEIRGERHLYMAMFVHPGGSHMELRIEAHHDPVSRRRAIVRVDGEILSDTTFAPCLTPAVSDMRSRTCIREEAAHLIDVGDVLTVSVTDTEGGSSGQRVRTHDLLRVPLAGYKEVNHRLSGIASGVLSASVFNYSPPEFNPDLSPELIDGHMRLITDPATYRDWRAGMSEVFASDSPQAEGSHRSRDGPDD